MHSNKAAEVTLGRIHGFNVVRLATVIKGFVFFGEGKRFVFFDGDFSVILGVKVGVEVRVFAVVELSPRGHHGFFVELNSVGHAVVVVGFGHQQQWGPEASHSPKGRTRATRVRGIREPPAFPRLCVERVIAPCIPVPVSCSRSPRTRAIGTSP